MLFVNGGILSGLIAGMLWGLDGVLIGKIGSPGNFISAVLFAACIHDGFGALWIFIVNLHNGRTKQYLQCFKSKQFIIIFLCALSGGAAGMTLNITAIRLAGASYACAITSAYPVAGSIAGIIFLKEKCNIYSVCGIVSVALGAVLTGLSPVAGSHNPHFLMGIAAAFMAMVCWALEGTLSKSAMEDISPDVLVGIREMVSCITYIVVLAFIVKTGGNHGMAWKPGTGQSAVLIAASAAGAFSYLCWYRSMDISGVTIGMSLNATYALWAAVFDILVNGSRLSFHMFAGTVVILIGTVLTIYADKIRGDRGVLRSS